MTIHIAYVDNTLLHQNTFCQIIHLLNQSRGLDSTLQTYDTQESAINYLPFERPDMVFVNLRMRNGRHTAGLDIIRALHNHPLCQNIAIIGMAEAALPIDRSAAIAAGCHDFVPLPVHFQDVADVVAPFVTVR